MPVQLHLKFLLDGRLVLVQVLKGTFRVNGYPFY